MPPENRDTFMEIQLPPHALFQQFCRHENGWSDHYGAVQVAAAYAGIACPTHYRLNGIWQHGVFGPWNDVAPDSLCYNVAEARKRPVFVARPDQAELLKRQGYSAVRAIGMPIVYTPAPTVSRSPGSLLVVPTHTLVGDAFTDRAPFENYADEIVGIAHHFRQVVICVHPNCQKNGLWVDEFSRRGFKIVYGTLTNDAHALSRMRMMFAQFESVTTNGWGSHVAYALAFGAKVSICGKQPQRAAADYLRDQAWAANPSALQAMLAPETLAREREFLKAFYQSPEHGVADVATGRWLIGADQRLPAKEMAKVWDVLVTPTVSVEQQIRGFRQEMRREASQLVAVGRRADAAQLLVQFALKAVETRNPRAIQETLAEVAVDLFPLDPAKSEYLAGEARNLAARLAPEHAVGGA